MLDSLDPQVHRDGPPAYLSPEAELVVADVRDREAVRKRARRRRPARAPRSGRRRRPVDVRDRALLLGQHRRRGGRAGGGRGGPRPAGEGGRRLVDVDLRRGPVPLPGRGRRGRTRPALRRAARPARVGAALPGAAASRSRPLPTPGDEAARTRPPSTRSRSATTRSCSSPGAGRTACPATALRFFNVFGPRQSLSNPYTGVAAIFASRLLNGRPPGVFEDGLPDARLRARLRHRGGARRCAASPAAGDGSALNVGTGRPVTRARRRRRALPAAWASRSSRRCATSTAPATCATASRTSRWPGSELGYEPAVGVRGRHGRARRLARRRAGRGLRRRRRRTSCGPAV